MEKFQKYCLSVLLVIISTNISAQVSNGTFKIDDCKQLQEFYSQFLNSGDLAAAQKTVLNLNSKRRFSISHKENADNLLGDFLFNKDQKKNFQNNGNQFSENEKQNQLLKNFFKNNKKNLLTENLYFKTKVSKIRNKDYLDTVS